MRRTTRKQGRQNKPNKHKYDALGAPNREEFGKVDPERKWPLIREALARISWMEKKEWWRWVKKLPHREMYYVLAFFEDSKGNSKSPDAAVMRPHAVKAKEFMDNGDKQGLFLYLDSLPNYIAKHFFAETDLHEFMFEPERDEHGYLKQTYTDAGEVHELAVKVFTPHKERDRFMPLAGSVSDALEKKMWVIGELERMARQGGIELTRWSRNPGDGTEELSRWDIRIAMLRNTEPLYVSKDIAHMIRDVSASPVPGWVMREEGLPCPYGFAWFADYMAYIDGTDPEGSTFVGRGEEWFMEALSWVRVYVQWDFDMHLPPRAYSPTPLPGTSVAYEILSWWRNATTGSKEIVPLTTVVASPGSTLGGAEVVTERVDGKDGVLRSWERRVVHVFQVFQSFVEQQILVTATQDANRAARRRVEATWKPEDVKPIHVVTLRRHKYTGIQNEGDKDVPWSCRWLVRGHWRQQPCGQHMMQRRPVWITPYVKGPEDKPMKTPGVRVFDVAR